jgi:two-component system chemotaxis sensor kinase CheA
LVEAAGYRIVSDDAEDADVAIVLAEHDAAPVGPARNTIRLRQDPDDAGTSLDTIYRYDRDGLLAALKQVRQGKTA